MDDFLTAIGLVLVIEGIIYGLFPDQMERLLATRLTMPPEFIRRSGLSMALIGIIVVWFMRGG